MHILVRNTNLGWEQVATIYILYVGASPSNQAPPSHDETITAQRQAYVQASLASEDENVNLPDFPDYPFSKQHKSKVHSDGG